MTATTATKPSAAREVRITRVFDAPRDLVFKAWTDAQHMAQWWGPHQFNNPVCELDARPGGALRIHMRGPDGVVHPMTGTFREVVEPERLVFTAVVEDQDGNAVLEALTTVTFARQGRKTKVTVHAKAVGLTPLAPQMLAGMQAGWTQSLERLATLLAQANTAAERGTDDEARIRKVLDDRARALREKDATLAVAHLADDAVTFTLAPPLQFTGAEARDKAALEAWFATWQGPIGWKLCDLRISVGGGVAFARGLGHMTGTKVDGEAINLWTRSTVCFRQIGGAWKIVHEHTSVPFYMDGSYRAAIDLEP